jgi:hypothetical protein
VPVTPLSKSSQRGRSPLFSYCANGKCTEAFDYRKGRLFRFQRRLAEGEGSASHAVVHFWLCPRCIEIYTLEYRSRSGIAVLRLKHPAAGPPKRKKINAAEPEPIQVAVPLGSE